MGRESRPDPPTIVFDLDGTLVDTAQDLVATLNAVGARAGLPPVSLSDGKAMVGGGVRVMIERAFAANGRDLSAPVLDRLMAEFLVHYAEHMADSSRAYPGAELALDKFAAGGWRLAVCTNKVERIAVDLLERLGVARYFSAIAGQDTFGFRKPDPRHLTETIRRAGGVTTRAVMVGDSETDVATARAAGIPVVVVSFGYSLRDVKELGASRVIGDFGELWEAVALLTPEARGAAASAGLD